jgi:hypothetical protein
MDLVANALTAHERWIALIGRHSGAKKELSVAQRSQIDLRRLKTVKIVKKQINQSRSRVAELKS